MSSSTRSRPEWDRLLSSAQKNDANEIHRLVSEEKVSPSHSNQIKQSALHIACLWGNIDAVQTLLSHSADIKLRNRLTGATPLHSCVQSSKEPAMNRFHCAKLLIDAGADVQAKDLYGLSPLKCLELEVARVKTDLGDEYVNEMRKILADDVNQDRHDPILFSFVEAESLDGEGLKTYLRDRDHQREVDTFRVDERHPLTGKTALLVAIDRLVGNEDETAIGEKLLRDLSSMIQMLLFQGSDANVIPDKIDFDTQLEIAAPLCVVCKALAKDLSKISDISEINTSVRSLYLQEVALCLLSHGAKVSSSVIHIMHDAARRGYSHVIQFWVKILGIDPNIKGRQGLTPLHFAARSGKIDIVRLLLSFSSEDGPSVDLTTVDDRGRTAVDAARANCNDKIVEILVENMH